MAKITLQGNEIHTVGDLPSVGDVASDFELVGSDLSPVSLSDFKGKKLVLNVFPSLDTDVCAASVRRFNSELNGLENTEVLCVSADLPFAHSRFCVSEGLENVKNASTFRNPEFGKAYGLTIVDGALAGLMARAVIVLDENSKVIYTELVDEIAQDPDFEAALEVLR